MAEQRRPSSGGQGRSNDRQARSGGERSGPRKSDSGRSDERGQSRRSSSDRGERSGQVNLPDKPRGERSGQNRRTDGDRRDVRGGQFRRSDRDVEPRTADQERYDGPPIPEHITGKELDRSVAAQLRSLPAKLSLRVARHLVAAGEAMDADPTLAYQHTLAARARAGRLAVVREAVGEAAYAAGEYAEALQELRAARRMNGSHAYLAVMADCERALGRPDRALNLVRSAPREGLSPSERTELTIVEAGARRDRGELEAALRTLELAPLDTRARGEWVARLRYVYADTLVEAGRLEDALQWFHRTEAVDGAGLTDASDRAVEIERRLGDN